MCVALRMRFARFAATAGYSVFATFKMEGCVCAILAQAPPPGVRMQQLLGKADRRGSNNILSACAFVQRYGSTSSAQRKSLVNRP